MGRGSSTDQEKGRQGSGGLAPKPSPRLNLIRPPCSPPPPPDILAAIDWAVKAKNSKTHNICAINLSLGSVQTYRSPCAGSAYTSAFAAVRQAGIVPVVAAGNAAVKTGLPSPARAPGAVSGSALCTTRRFLISLPGAPAQSTPPPSAASPASQTAPSTGPSSPRGRPRLSQLARVLPSTPAPGAWRAPRRPRPTSPSPPPSRPRLLPTSRRRSSPAARLSRIR